MPLKEKSSTKLNTASVADMTINVNLKTKMRNRMILITFKGSKPVLSYVPHQRSRLIGYNYDFAYISFAGLNNGKDVPQSEYFSQIKSILTDGVSIGGNLYSFFDYGYKNLLSKGCFLHKVTSTNLRNGNIQNHSDVRKYIKSNSYMLSSADQIVNLKTNNYIEINDGNVSEGNTFSCGSGIISTTFNQVIQKSYHQKVFRKYIPQVLQISYKGYCGTLVAQRDLKHMKGSPVKNMGDSEFQEVEVIFLKSMRKYYEPASTEELYIMDRAKPCSPASISANLIAMLSTLGVPEEIFVQRIEEHFDIIKHANFEMTDALELMKYKGRQHILVELWKKQLLPNIDYWVRKEIYKDQIAEINSFKNPSYSKRMLFMILKSALLLGVSDPTGKLKEGQCYVRVTTNYSTLGSEILLGPVMITRPSCLYPGDIQSFEAVNDIPELYHLADCVVFSAAGISSPANPLGGGNLDGDKYFVCWDEDLFPPLFVTPLDYTKYESNEVIPFQKTANCQLDLIEYFCDYHASLESILNLYYQWIRYKKDRAFSAECKQLNELYWRCLDGQKINIPSSLSLPGTPDGSYPYILDVLEEKIQIIVKDFSFRDCD